MRKETNSIKKHECEGTNVWEKIVFNYTTDTDHLIGDKWCLVCPGDEYESVTVIKYCPFCGEKLVSNQAEK